VQGLFLVNIPSQQVPKQTDGWGGASAGRSILQTCFEYWHSGNNSGFLASSIQSSTWQKSDLLAFVSQVAHYEFGRCYSSNGREESG